MSHEFAKEYAETEFERYRIIQDRLSRSDFEKMQLEGGDLPELPLEGMMEEENIALPENK